MSEGKRNSFSGAVGELLVRALGPMSDEIGEQLADYVKGWRRKNLEKVSKEIETIEAEYAELGSPEQLSDGFKILALEGAASEETDEVRTLWARLIISAKRGNIGEEYKPFLECLKSFTPIMAVTFLAMSKQFCRQSFASVWRIGLFVDDLEAAHIIAKHDDNKIVQSLGMLEHLGIITKIGRDLYVQGIYIRDISTRSIDNSAYIIENPISQLNPNSEIQYNLAIRRQSIGDNDHLIILAQFSDFGLELARKLFSIT